MKALSKMIAIVGPTGVGKSALGFELGRRFGGEIVNADSRLVYKDMDIGTAKPGEEHRSVVPHHLIDIISPTEPFNLAHYLDLARWALESVQARPALPFLVGGTGLYVRAILEGFQAPRVPANWELRRSLEARAIATGGESLKADLLALDPVAAQRIDARNTRRLIRALEVCIVTGIPFSQLQTRNGPVYQTRVIGLTMNRQALYSRLDRRVEDMIENGWVKEVERLVETGCGPDTTSMSALGYRDILAHLLGELSLDEVVENIQRATRRFARRQYSWFRPSSSWIHWLDAEDDVESAAGNLVTEFLTREE